MLYYFTYVILYYMRKTYVCIYYVFALDFVCLERMTVLHEPQLHA